MTHSTTLSMASRHAEIMDQIRIDAEMVQGYESGEKPDSNLVARVYRPESNKQVGIPPTFEVLVARRDDPETVLKARWSVKHGEIVFPTTPGGKPVFFKALPEFALEAHDYGGAIASYQTLSSLVRMCLAFNDREVDWVVGYIFVPQTGAHYLL